MTMFASWISAVIHRWAFSTDPTRRTTVAEESCHTGTITQNEHSSLRVKGWPLFSSTVAATEVVDKVFNRFDWPSCHYHFVEVCEGACAGCTERKERYGKCSRCMNEFYQHTSVPRIPTLQFLIGRRRWIKLTKNLRRALTLYHLGTQDG